ncbi:YdbH domain-containing protein [Litorimonas haliclonae]|uniref:intermembrane phospholipid transport protein YdbH family protein n=1 Tax=Litorimonas haliclonae TaxID=2081977 RepID=UPI0039EE8086
MSLQTDTTSQKSKSERHLRKKWSVWRWLGVALLCALLVIAIVVVWTWSNRYSVLERYVVSVLHDQGIEAELSIKTANLETVTIDDVKLTYQSDRDPFFTARRIEADYLWKEAMQGKVKRLRIVEPEARITLDENFKIVDGWLPPKSESSPGGLSIPENGFFLEDATFDLETPYGSPEIDVSATIHQTDEFEATLVIDETDLNYNDWALKGSARLDLDVNGNTKNIDSLIRVRSLARETLRLSEATLEVNGVLIADTTLPVDLEALDMSFNGQVNGTADRLETEPFTLDGSLFNWTGDITRQTSLSSPIGLKGQIELLTEQFTFADKSRAQDLASMLTLSDALSKTPIAQHFAPSLTEALEGVLEQSEIKATADVDFQNDKAVISLLSPMDVVRDQTELLITSTPGEPVYIWDRVNDRVTASFDAALNRPIPMTLKETRIEAASENGWQLSDITLFSGSMSTSRPWQVTSSNELARLAPFNATIDYRVGVSRLLNITGGVDFDGRVPGGYVEGFKTGGELNLRLPSPGEEGLSMSYFPKVKKVIVETLQTETDWNLKDIALDLTDGKNIFALNEPRATINAGLENVEFTAVNKLDGRDFDMTLGNTRAKGLLNSRTETQNWTLLFEQATLQSDSFPVEGTRGSAPKGTLNVLRTNEALTFDFNSESIDITVSQGSVKGMTVAAAGTPEDYAVEHEGGDFTSDAMDVPDWPVTGTVEFEDGVFTGEAVARVPKANNTPVNISYNFSDGEGTAHIVLESLTFKPSGLQPQTLAPALAGKVAAVEGNVSADMQFKFAPDTPLESGGVLNILDMNFGTAPGPVTGLNTQIEFSSLMPFQTKGRQILTMENFDPGIPLDDGTIEYELVPEGVKIYNARWPLNLGAFELDPFTWIYGADENRVVMRLDDISINELLQTFGNEKLEATGTVRGVFPIVIRGLNVLVDDGYLEAKDGGVIRFVADETAPDDRFQGDNILETWSSGDEGVYNDLAKEALREFNYRELTASIDGPLDGDVELGVVFNGANKKVLNGQPFEFDIEVQGELLNILRSFNSNAQIKSELLKKENVTGN